MTTPKVPLADAGAVTCPKTGHPLYRTVLQDQPPSWVRDGVKLKVKMTPNTRITSRGSSGLTVRVPSWGSKNDSAAWAGEECVIKLEVVPHKTEEEVRAGGCYYGGRPYVAGEGGYYSYTVEFARGRTYTPRKPEEWGHFVRVKTPTTPEAT
jgi:hypothetical protein